MVTAEQYVEGHWRKKKIWTHLTAPKHQARFKACVDLLVGQDFADIGCGFGHSTAIMREMRGGRWTGVDFYPGVVENVKEYFPDLASVGLAKVSDLPFLPEFDSVVCSEVIEHVENDQELVDGLLAITRHNLVITTPLRPVNDPGHLRVYAEESLAALFKGYTVEISTLVGLFFVVVIRDVKTPYRYTGADTK